jgi:hypothetical protein
MGAGKGAVSLGVRVSGHDPCWVGVTEQAVRLPTIAANTHAAPADGHAINGNLLMWLILLEALLALLVFVGIVWWTMFAGRSKGELSAPPDSADQDKP